MTRINYRRNKWRNSVEAKCLDCGEFIELQNYQLVESYGRSWPHQCSGLELEGQEIVA